MERINRIDLGFSRRVKATFFLLAALISPHAKVRAFFHRLRGVRIGPDVEIGYLVMIDNLYPEKVTIKRGATVTYGCTVLAHDASQRYARGGREVVRETVIGKRAFIGVNSTILPGVRVGEKAIVGAGSVVSKDVPPGATVAGVPARLIRSRPS
jgi:acetyltransferase-like isoleucine patch superfamily enzyme